MTSARCRRGEHPALGLGLALAIDAGGTDRVVLHIGTAEPAVEDQVRREGDERNVGARRRRRRRFSGPAAFQAKQASALPLGVGDADEAGGVDHRPGPMPPQRVAHRRACRRCRARRGRSGRRARPRCSQMRAKAWPSVPVAPVISSLRPSLHRILAARRARDRAAPAAATSRAGRAPGWSKASPAAQAFAAGGDGGRPRLRSADVDRRRRRSGLRGGSAAIASRHCRTATKA